VDITPLYANCKHQRKITILSLFKFSPEVKMLRTIIKMLFNKKVARIYKKFKYKLRSKFFNKQKNSTDKG